MLLDLVSSVLHTEIFSRSIPACGSIEYSSKNPGFTIMTTLSFGVGLKEVDRFAMVRLTFLSGATR